MDGARGRHDGLQGTTDVRPLFAPQARQGDGNALFGVLQLSRRPPPLTRAGRSCAGVWPYPAFEPPSRPLKEGKELWPTVIYTRLLPKRATPATAYHWAIMPREIVTVQLGQCGNQGMIESDYRKING